MNPYRELYAQAVRDIRETGTLRTITVAQLEAIGRDPWAVEERIKETM